MSFLSQVNCILQVSFLPQVNCILQVSFLPQVNCILQMLFLPQACSLPYFSRIRPLRSIHFPFL